MIRNMNYHSYILLHPTSYNLPRPCLFKALAKAVVSLILVSAAPVTAQAQSCPNIPSGGGENISASISINSTGELLADQGMVPAGTVTLCCG